MSSFKEVVFEDIARFKKGISYTSADYGSEDNGVPFITIKCLKKGGGYTSTGLKYFKGDFNHKDLLHKGDILFSATDLTRDGDIVGSPLRVPLLREEGNCLASMDLIKIEPNDEESFGDYIYYWLMSSEMRNRMVAFSAGSTVLHLDVKRVKKLRFNIPKKLYQQKIARILTAVDKVIERTENAIEKLKKIKQGMMHDLFTRGIDIKTGKLRLPYTEAPKLYKETELGWIPKEWEVAFLEDIVDILDSQRIPLNEDQRSFIPGEIPYYGANGVQGYINDFIFDEDLILIAEDGGYFDEYATRPIAYKISGKSWINNHAHILRARPNFIQDYVFFSLEHKNILSFIKGGTRTKLNQTELRMIPLKIPKFSNEQKVIAKKMNSINEQIIEQTMSVEKFKNIKQGLMQDLLTGKVEVTPDSQDKEYQEVD